MKFDILLAQYLYQQKKLDLPGIGSFTADDTVSFNDDAENQKQSLEGISFRNSHVAVADDALIEFIKVHTGKMKPLAISDLESFLTLGKQFLFMGKPFYLEGIGTLSLRKDGQFDFLPGEFVTTKLEDPNVERTEGKQRSVHEEDRIQLESNTHTIKKVLLVLALIAGVALVGWGGYYLYKQAAEDDSAFKVLGDSTTAAEDSTSFSSAEESQPSPAQNLVDTMAGQTTDAFEKKMGFYKFVVETTDNKLRAINQFNLLKSYGNPIQLETRDSSLFRLYYTLPSTSDDTLRIRDSLNRRYYGNTPSIRVTIENN